MKDEMIVARIIPTANRNFDSKKAFALLNRLTEIWPKEEKVRFITTCGGFIQFEFPWEKFLSKTQREKEALKQVLIKAARKEINTWLNGALKNKLKKISRYLTIGIDSREEQKYGGRHIELVALVDLKNNTMYFTGKSLPTNSQERKLIREENLKSHFVESAYGKVMLLGCHDLNFFNPRGIATARGWRKSTRNRYIKLAKKFKPKYVIQHPHYTDSNHIWKNGWAEMMNKLSSVVFYCSAWKYGPGRPRQKLGKVLNATTNKPDNVINFYYDLWLSKID
jgi:hypothetical protein